MKTKLTLMTIIAVMFIPICVNAISESAPIFLTIEPGSRSGAMGHAYVAQVDDAFAGWWNPGAMAFNRETQIAGIHTNWLGDVFDDIYYEYIGWNQYMEDIGNVGANVTFITYGQQEYTGEFSAEPEGVFSSFELAFGASYAYQFAQNKGLGVTFKFIYSSLGPGQGHTDLKKAYGMTYAFDIGYLHKGVSFGEFLAIPNLDFGFNFQNIGPNIVYQDQDQADPLPITWRMGLSYKLIDSEYSKLTFNTDMSKILANDDPIYKRVFTAWYDDFNIRKDEQGNKIDDFASLNNFINSVEVKETVFGFGAEYVYLDLLSLRTGYVMDRAGEIEGLSIGAGIHKEFGEQYRLGIDFAMQPAGELTEYNRTYSIKLDF